MSRFKIKLLKETQIHIAQLKTLSPLIYNFYLLLLLTLSRTLIHSLQVLILSSLLIFLYSAFVKIKYFLVGHPSCLFIVFSAIFLAYLHDELPLNHLSTCVQVILQIVLFFLSLCYPACISKFHVIGEKFINSQYTHTIPLSHTPQFRFFLAKVI